MRINKFKIIIPTLIFTLILVILLINRSQYQNDVSSREFQYVYDSPSDNIGFEFIIPSGWEINHFVDDMPNSLIHRVVITDKDSETVTVSFSNFYEISQQECYRNQPSNINKNEYVRISDDEVLSNFRIFEGDHEEVNNNIVYFHSEDAFRSNLVEGLSDDFGNEKTLRGCVSVVIRYENQNNINQPSSDLREVLTSVLKSMEIKTY